MAYTPLQKKLFFLLTLILVVGGFFTVKNIQLNAKSHQLTQMPPATLEGIDPKTQKSQTYNLESFKGKWIVFEWFNNDCPYVDKHYDTQNMQALQKKYTDQGVIWLTVASSKKDKQGYLDAGVAKLMIDDRKPQQSAILFDHDGQLARNFGATATPHMFVVDPQGTIVYRGAIDDKSSFRKTSVEGARNYVDEVLGAYLGKDLQGRKNLVTQQPVYGCSIKNDLKSAPQKPLS